MRVVDVGFDRTVLAVVICSAMLKLNQDFRKDNPSRSRTIMCKVLAKDTDSTQLAWEHAYRTLISISNQ